MINLYNRESECGSYDWFSPGRKVGIWQNEE